MSTNIKNESRFVNFFQCYVHVRPNIETDVRKAETNSGKLKFSSYEYFPSHKKYSEKKKKKNFSANK